MRVKSKILFLVFAFLFIFLGFNHYVDGQANVSRSPSTRSVSPRIAVDSAGNIHVVWAEYYTDSSGDAFYARYNLASDVWEAPVNLSNSRICHSSEYRPVGIDIDGSNNVYVVYVENTGTTYRIKLRIYSGGTWGAAFEVGTGTREIDSARISVDSSGNIFTCWWTVNGGSVFSRARIGGTWEAQRAISSGGYSKFPNISVGNNAAFCVWMTKLPPYQTYYSRRDNSLNAAWSAPGAVLPGTIALGHDTPDVEVDSNDVAHVVIDPVIATGGTRKVIYTQGPPWSAAQTISTSTLLHYPSIFERGGNSYICWQLGAWGFGSGVNFNHRINGSWTGIGSVPNAKGASFTDVATSPSQDRVYFVWDDIGKNPQGTWEIYCNMGQTGPPPPPSNNPVAIFTASPSSGSPPLTVNFDGSSSYDPNGSIVSYSWNFGDGGTGSGAIITHTYNTRGTFFATLTVTDNQGNTGSSSRSIEVAGTNEPPIAEFSCSPTSGLVPLSVTFNASASRDPDGTISQYRWDFGDGQTTRGRVVTHLYTRGGTFMARLTVVDNLGATGTKSRTISVLSIRPPLNIHWTTQADVSLFQTRYVTEVTWERNPANDALGAKIVLYRIYRKKSTLGDSAYKSIGQVDGSIYRYLDTGGAPNEYSYTVTAIDSGGHESPFKITVDSFVNPLQEKTAQDTKIKGRGVRF